MNDPDQREGPQPQHAPQNPRYRFSLGSIFLVILALNATFAGGFYMVRGFGGSRGDQLLAILFTVVAPLFITSLASLWILATRRRRNSAKTRTRRIKG